MNPETQELHMLVSILAQMQDVVANAEAARAGAFGAAMLGKGLGTGLAVLGAGLGIGWIGSRMTESMARQPEIAGNIQVAALILAAFIEGAALFGLVIMLLIPT
jgi:F-type H+-transporting ATPase subunit c